MSLRGGGSPALPGGHSRPRQPPSGWRCPGLSVVRGLPGAGAGGRGSRRGGPAGTSNLLHRDF